MRVAIIDLGTNTFNLLIVDIGVIGQFQSVYNTKSAVKIGEGALVAGKLLPKPMARGKKALAEYQKIAKDHGCDKIFAFATSGIRSTSNGTDFVSVIKKDLDLEISVIDGNEEAQLIYEGVDLAIKFEADPVVIMDIGGGSTEFIIANNAGVLWKKSYKLGISRILQIIKPSDPLTEEDLRSFDQLLAEQLTDLLEQCRLQGVKTLIGSSGSFDSFIEIIWAQEGTPKLANSVVREEFNLNELKSLHSRLVSFNYAERKAIPGLVEMRVDTIHLASHLVQWVLHNCGLERLLLSTYALKEGVLHRVMEDRL